VRRDDVLEAVVLLHRLLEVVEVSRPRVGFVAEHHPRPLAIGHRVCAGVGQEIDVDVFRTEQEGVEAGVGECAFAIGARKHVNRLDDLDLPGFGPAARTWHGVRFRGYRKAAHQWWENLSGGFTRRVVKRTTPHSHPLGRKLTR
jgi:hypothetical protein